MKIAILDNIRSLHNVGSIFRTADGAGINKVICCGYTGTPPDRRIEKVSLGAEDFIEWEKCDSTVECCKKLKLEGFEIIALEQTDKSEDLFKAQFDSQNLAMVLGNEVDGISPEVLELCDHHVEIPMYGKKSSLNVSVAAGILFYQIC